MPPRPRSLKARALQLLAQRDQSKVELRRKLLAHGRAAARKSAAEGALTSVDDDVDAALAAEVQAVLEWLEAHRFLCLERFAESRVNARAERFGNLRIRQELAMHEVALGAEAARALSDSELARARAVRARKFAAPPASASETARQARFLGARGFSADVIRRALREPASEDADD